MGALFFFRVPREGGDPDPYAPKDRSWNILVLRRAQDEDECEVRALFFPHPVLTVKALIRLATSRRCERVWIPAFAGKTAGWDGRGSK